jgi:hypothetical protein
MDHSGPSIFTTDVRSADPRDARASAVAAIPPTVTTEKFTPTITTAYKNAQRRPESSQPFGVENFGAQPARGAELPSATEYEVRNHAKWSHRGRARSVL